MRGYSIQYAPLFDDSFIIFGLKKIRLFLDYYYKLLINNKNIMNKFLLINIKPIFFLAIFSLSSISIAKEVNELLEKHGRMYEPGVEEPYTGKYILYHENGNKRYEGNFSIGKMDGKQIKWHENGQKSYEANFKYGKQNGPYIFWYENGQKSYEANYKKGKEHGIVKSWDREGNLTKTEILENGKVVEVIK
jgi:antitoxin component YwqK of YwqJK toxin-antitoxin module|tara:strand:+ start:69 stop:641 length:573 start_codon:yes stop_codon:yes gene_type:complete